MSPLLLYFSSGLDTTAEQGRGGIMKCDICVCTYDNPACRGCDELKKGLESLSKEIEDKDPNSAWYGLYIIK